jgi:hypothetical protein
LRVGGSPGQHQAEDLAEIGAEALVALCALERRVASLAFAFSLAVPAEVLRRGDENLIDEDGRMAANVRLHANVIPSVARDRCGLGGAEKDIECASRHTDPSLRSG